VADIYLGKTESNMHGFEIKQNSLSVEKNKIWSENTGRAADGEMTGDLVAIKYKIVATLPPMSQAASAQLDDIISQAFFYVKFADPASSTGALKTVKAYSGDASYPVYSYVTGALRYVGVELSIIGK